MNGQTLSATSNVTASISQHPVNGERQGSGDRFQAQDLRAMPNRRPARDNSSLEQIMEQNLEHAARFAENRIFELLADGQLDDLATRNRFFAALRSWSDHFQHLMHARFAFTSDPRFAPVFLAHLVDELGHNEDLAEQPLWDPMLDALGSWFTQQSLILDNIEITAMVHLVLERAATVFYPRFAAAFGEPADRRHFEKHLDEVDCEHERMGVELLEGLRAAEYLRIEVVMKRSWGVMNALLARIAELAVDEAGHGARDESSPQTSPGSRTSKAALVVA